MIAAKASGARSWRHFKLLISRFFESVSPRRLATLIWQGGVAKTRTNEYSEELRAACQRGRTLAKMHAGSQRQLEMLDYVLQRFEAKGSVTCVRFPLLILGALGVDHKRSSGLVVATTLFYAGVDLLDDVADGDLSEEDRRQGADYEFDLVAATLFFSLTCVALSEISDAPSQLLDLQNTLMQGFTEMAAGQHTDLHFKNAFNVSSELVEDSVHGKSGAEFAMFAKLAATVARSTPDDVSLWEAFGRSYGVAAQLASDVMDLFGPDRSRDLANGARTLPLALYIEAIESEDERIAFRAMLERAKKNAEGEEEVRSRLLSEGVLQKLFVIVEMYKADALSALERLRLAEDKGARLFEHVMRVSFASPTNTQPESRKES